MAIDRSGEIEIIVNTLLQLGERVAEVSREHVISKIWNNKKHALQVSADDYIGKRIVDIKNDRIIGLCDEQVEVAFQTGEHSYLEYNSTTNDIPLTYGIRIITCHPDKDFLFIVIENLSLKKANQLIEDKWKLPFDAPGDNERKIEEEKYFTTAQLLSTLVNNLQDSILVTDENWKIVFVNQVFCDMFAIPGKPAELNGMDMRRNLETRKSLYKEPEKFEERTIEIFNRKEVALNEEWEMVDGRILCRDYAPLSFGNNNKGGIWKLRDITAQRNIEKQFEHQRLFYERILNNISVDIAVYDAERRYLFVNPIAVANEELRAWLIGKNDEEYCRYKKRPISIAERRREIFDTTVSEKQVVEWEEKTETPSGAIEYYLRRMFPVFKENGALDIMIGYGLNITERIVARQAAKTNIDTFSSAFDYSGIGMALINLEGKWVDVNKALCELTGYSKEELLQHSYHEITYAEDDEMDRPLINQLLKMEISTYTIEKRYVSKANKIILVSLTVSLVWNHDDSPKFFIAQVVDITEKKALENDITRKNFELEATRVSLVNKISQLEELSHIIAHNLRGPAGNVKTFSEILLAKQENNDSVVPLKNAFTDEEVVKFIHESSTALMDSLSTLMEITEIKLNKEIPYNDCDVAAVINGIVTQLQGLIYEKKAKIKSKLDVGLIHYPKAYLENILYNLVSNALKYSSAAMPPEITISTKTLKNKKTQLIVKDNGLGIDLQQYGDKVFKLNQIFHPGYDSKGVGLYITKTQIESLGGSIGIKSKPNEGCEFIVTL